MTTTVRLEIIHSLRSLLKIHGIKFKESNGLFKISPESEYHKEQLNKFFITRKIEIKEEVTNNE